MLLGGVDLRDLPPDQLNELVSFVQQEKVLFRGTVADSIRIACPWATDKAVREAARVAQAHEFIELLPQGYATVLGDGGQGLSGGERQRLALARAVLKDAPVLVLDEATAHADPE